MAISPKEVFAPREKEDERLLKEFDDAVLRESKSTAGNEMVFTIDSSRLNSRIIPVIIAAYKAAGWSSVTIDGPYDAGRNESEYKIILTGGAA